MKRIDTTDHKALDVMFQDLMKEVKELKKENEKLKTANPVEVTGDGLESLLGEMVQLWCLNYIYSGKLVGVNTNDVVLEDAVVVYETGKMTDKTFKFAEPVASKELFVRTAVIESYSLAPQLVK
jgi:hypothetical protein